MESEQLLEKQIPKNVSQSSDEVVAGEIMAVDFPENAKSVDNDDAVVKTESIETTIVAARVELTDAELAAANEDGGTSTVIELQTIGSCEIAESNVQEENVSEDKVNKTIISAENSAKEQSTDNLTLETSEAGVEIIGDDDDPEEILDEADGSGEENEISTGTKDLSANEEESQETGEEINEDDVSDSDESNAEEEDIEAEEEYDSNDEQDDEAEAEDPDEIENGDVDDDIAIISDSSDEDEDATGKPYNLKAATAVAIPDDLYDDSDEVESDMSADPENDCDYDDLMDDVIVSKTFKNRELYKIERNRRDIEKFRNGKVMKRHRKCDWRLKLKKRSVKWLKTGRMRNVTEPQTDVTVFDLLTSEITSTSKISQPCNSEPQFIITQVESFASAKMTNASNAPTYSSESKPNESGELRQIDEHFECVKNAAVDECRESSEDGKQNLRQKLISKYEHNKENIERNDELETNVPRSNGASLASVSPKSSETRNETKNVSDVEESDEIMEISDEPSIQLSSISATEETVIEKKPNDGANSAVKESSKCDMDIPVVIFECQVDSNYPKKESEVIEKAGTKNIQIDEEAESFRTLGQTEPNEKSIEIATIDLPKSETTGSSIEPVKSESPSPKQVGKIFDEKTNQQVKLPCSPTTESAPKRSRSRSPKNQTTAESEELHPAKKLKAHIDSNFSSHDQILNEYIEGTSNNSADEIQKHLTQLFVEMQTLNEMIKAKEVEWNNLLHLKKIKEEICFRLTRKKQIMDIMSTKVGQINDADDDGDGTICEGDVSLLSSYVDNLNNITADSVNGKILANTLTAAGLSGSGPASTPIAASKSSAAALSSTPNNAAQMTNNSANFTVNLLNNLSNISGISMAVGSQQQHQQISSTNIANNCNSIVQNILQNRANMKSSDLIREKATTQRLHRILVSRNILPKPSTITAATSNGNSTANLGFLSKSSSAPVATSTSSTPHTVPLLSLGNNVPMNLTNSNSGQGSLAADRKPILNNYLTSSASIQKQLGEMLNGHHNQQISNVTNGCQLLGIGRQGAFKDVKSIIADYRQKHPETVPRRGRRIKSANLANMSSGEASAFLSNMLKSEGKGAADLGSFLAKFDGNSRPSSNDSSQGATNLAINNSTMGNLSFKDVLIQFAKMNEQNNAERLSSTAASASKYAAATNQGNATAPPPFPEVTLHPVTASQSIDQATGSLLHGILTKYNRPNISTATTTTPSNYNSSFSPTLARLLTAPERITATHNSHTNLPSYQASTSVSAATSLNISKMVSGHNSEITITPVVCSHQVPTLLQQQLEQQQHMSSKRERIKFENLLNIDDEADDSIDRLVIDEGGDSSMGAEENHRIAPSAYGLEFNENEVPACQGCKKNEAQFVCAGCANQLYCSRECQVAAWDEHSEVCTG